MSQKLTVILENLKCEFSFAGWLSDTAGRREGEDECYPINKIINKPKI